MKRFLTFTFGVGWLLVPQTAQAQDTNPVTFAVYYQCDQNRETVADLIEQNVMGPILDAHVEAGRLLSWGWLSHRIGGDWRRVEYLIAPDRTTLMSVRNAVIEALQEGDAQLASRELTAICPDHDDYIWTVEAASDPDAVFQARPAAGMSTYYQCDISREGRADELVSEVFAPIYNNHVGDGALNSWSWLAHSVGGVIRRLLTIDAADGETLMDHREAVIADVQSQAPEAGAEFNEICHTHEDYLWDITISRP